MDRKNICVIVGGILIVVSIVVGAFLISGSTTTSNGENVLTATSVLTMDELAEYLSVSTKDIEEIIEKDDRDKASVNSYEIYQYIPYISISGENRFVKKEIDKWLEYQSH